MLAFSWLGQRLPPFQLILAVFYSLFAAGEFAGTVRIVRSWIDPEIDPRFLTPRKVKTDTTPPVITAALVNDTGDSNSDGLTSDPTIQGKVQDESAITSFRAGFDNTPLSSFVDLTANLNQSPTLSSRLPSFSRRLTWEQPWLKEPQQGSSSLPIAKNISAGSNNNNPTPTITGTGEAGSLIQLFESEQLVGTTTVKADGTWEISVPTLSDGLYNITALARLQPT